INISYIMSKENKCYRLGNPPLILFRYSPLYDLNAEWNHVDYVPFAATSMAVAVSLRWHDGNVGVMEPMMRRSAWITAWCRRIRSPEIAQLPVNVLMRGIMKRSRIINSFLVPASDLVSNEAGFFESKSAQQRVDLRSGRRVCQPFV